MQTVPKFNAEDRRLLIQEIERIQGVQLMQIASSQKLYKSNKDLHYLIQGGTGLWHGINEHIIDQLKKDEFVNKEKCVYTCKEIPNINPIYSLGPVGRTSCR